MSSDRGADYPSAGQGADHKPEVLAAYGTPFELVHKLFVGTKSAGDYEESGRILVQAVDDSGAGDLSKLAKVV
jgi:hypothetical protein